MTKAVLGFSVCFRSSRRRMTVNHLQIKWNPSWRDLLRATLISMCVLSPVIAAPFFHKKYGWHADKYFDDPQAIALCKAIEANDLEEMDRLIVAGANVNAKGFGGMTPLLWAYPENHPERLQRLLEHGADPNVPLSHDFKMRGSIVRPGDSVTHLACETSFDKYFDYVFSHGGDPNLVHPRSQKTPIYSLIRGQANDKNRKVKRLIALGANLNANNNNKFTGYRTPADCAVSYFGQYDLALILLESGADYFHHRPDHTARLIHELEGAGRRKDSWDQKTRTDFQNLVKWLEERGESIDEAAKDKLRWRQWRADGTFEQNMAKELRAIRDRRTAKEITRQSDKKSSPVRNTGRKNELPTAKSLLNLKTTDKLLRSAR